MHLGSRKHVGQSFRSGWLFHAMGCVRRYDTCSVRCTKFLQPQLEIIDSKDQGGPHLCELPLEDKKASAKHERTSPSPNLFLFIKLKKFSVL